MKNHRLFIGFIPICRFVKKWRQGTCQVWDVFDILVTEDHSPISVVYVLYYVYYVLYCLIHRRNKTTNIQGCLIHLKQLISVRCSGDEVLDVADATWPKCGVAIGSHQYTPMFVSINIAAPWILIVGNSLWPILQTWPLHDWDLGDCWHPDPPGCYSYYPMVNVYITNWKDPPFSMGKLTISDVYQRVSNFLLLGAHHCGRWISWISQHLLLFNRCPNIACRMSHVFQH